MKKSTYIQMTQPFRDNPERAGIIHILNKILSWVIVASYIILLFYYFVRKDNDLLLAVTVPLSSFIALSVFRYLVNRPRPYEKFGLPPVIPKDTVGKSFPSRHVFSAFIIAFTYLMWSPFWPVGIILTLVAVAIAIIRVISGVHYISDVICGAAVALATAIVGYIIL